MLAPDAVLCVEAALLDAGRAGSVVCFFKNRQFACWDVASDQMLTGYPRDVAAQFPGLLEAAPGRRLRGALRVPSWDDHIYFQFEGEDDAVVWDAVRGALSGARANLAQLLPSSLGAGDATLIGAQLADGRPVIYGFKGVEYTRWTIGKAPPAIEDQGFPRRIVDDWKDGLVLAPRAGVYVDWTHRSSAHSNRKIYFFMGDLYLRWDVPSNTRNYRLDIIAGWKGWPTFA